MCDYVNGIDFHLFQFKTSRNCTNINDLLTEEERIIDVEWYDEYKNTNYNVDIQILANDRTGLLADVVREITGQKINIMGVNTKTKK